ncbi:MAG: AI-2E family transporter [Bacteroidetes bacterium]|nr:AI-2E family transporter [Bacteroidota bacterium]MBU1483471.1 AI-2E family transporter [Bacteroidota bacterium]MBU2269183.1 AI-2E family transporter [Bacteroidota bacterium]MBU2374438.1 AI-2E family transporter [Bacteroidota bacterium]
MSIFIGKQRNNIVLIILILLGVLILYSLRDLINAILGSIILYTIFKSLFIYLKKKIGRVFSALFIIVTSFIIIIIPFFTLSYMVVNRLTSLKKDQFMVKAMISRLDDYVGLKLNQPDLIDKYVSKFSDFVQDLFPTVVGGALNIFLVIVIMYFILYFMFVQYDLFEGNLLKYAPLKEHHAIQFGVELKNATYSNVLGQGLIALVQGMLVSICFFIVGINDAIFWGVIALFLSFMPVIGAPVVTLPATLILFLNGQTWQGTFMLLATLLVIINIDNVIRFIINKRLADTHPIITVIGVIIGLPLFGAAGLVFGPLLLVWFVHLLKIYEMDKMAEERLKVMQENKRV